MNLDPGIPYINTPSYCGAQLTFNRQGIGRETEDGLGYSGNELEGILMAGNTLITPSFMEKLYNQLEIILLYRVATKR